MFKSRTLFVIGAGASRELDLPTGNELALKIRDGMDVRLNDLRRGEGNGSGDVQLFSEFARSAQNDVPNYERAFWLIRDGILTQNSIDDFLDIHKDNLRVQRIGKAAIIKYILKAERSSPLFFDTSNSYTKMNMSRLENTWLLKFMRVLARGVALKDIEHLFDNVAFIVFNYDRCLEYFLVHALRNAYELSEADAVELMLKLTIIHPYGTAGDLKISGIRSGVEFGGGCDGHHQHLHLIEEIKTYTEQIDDHAELERIWDEVRRADQIAFLGFGFHDQNMRLLRPDTPLPAKNVFGTAYHMSDSDVEVVRAQTLAFFGDNDRRLMRDLKKIVLRSDLKCAELFDQYTKSLPA
jgi:hypothetical protein